jgi:hypothetical protein
MSAPAKSTECGSRDKQIGSTVHEATSKGLFSAIKHGIASMDEVVFLVSRDGKKFPIQEEVLKVSSDFFKATLETSMKESGKGLKFCSPHTVCFSAVHMLPLSREFARSSLLTFSLFWQAPVRSYSTCPLTCCVL